MKILLTGAGGFLGRAVAPALVNQGHEVRAVLRPSGGPPPARLEGIEPWWGDLRTGDLEAALEGIDAVVHLAAVMHGDVMDMFQGTVVPTERLLDAMVRAGTERMVHVSSLSVYDWRAPARVMAEDSPLEARPGARDGYAIAKLWQERLCRRYAAAHGWRLTVLRPGFIWGGERQWIDGIGIRLGPLLVVNGPWRRLPLTQVENCAECIALSVDCRAATNETINIIDADDTRAWSLSGDLMRRGAAPARWRVAIPYHAGLGLSMAASAVGRALLGPRVRLPGVLAPERYRARFRSLRFPNGKARRLLGWQPRARSVDLPGPAIRGTAG